MKIKVKCVGCGKTKEVDETQREQPLCEFEGLPMIAVSASSD